MKGNLLLFARDPGNANQIVALGELIRTHMTGREFNTLSESVAQLVSDLAIGRTPAQTIFAGSDSGGQVLEAAGIQNNSDLAEAVSANPLLMLREHRVDTVVTGLSDRDDRTPQALWRAATACGARSVALTDDTTIGLKHAQQDLNERFRDYNGEEIFPNLLCVVDENSRHIISAAGMPDDSIRVIGNLHLRRFCHLARAIDRDKIDGLRQEWGATKENRVVLYASEPITQMRKHGKARDHDELSLLAELIEQVRANKLGDTVPCDKNTVVVIRPHPRDEPTKFAPYLSDYMPRTIVSQNGSSAEAILAADAVVGITSMLLVEAAALNRPSISLIDFDPQAAASGT
ncbi:MAG: hypothetical protein OSB67_02190 [Alphaproteobacteria bacterium]|jgi:hypothetical protein|nr:hypothetical protein [Alphaproteobacteria bacterium]